MQVNTINLYATETGTLFGCFFGFFLGKNLCGASQGLFFLWVKSQKRYTKCHKGSSLVLNPIFIVIFQRISIIFTVF